eukprot:15459706-Alexandrium_andersonii.AAC.1
MAEQLSRRVQALAFPPEAERHCPACGRFKPQPLAMVRLDAAQYFKNANFARGRDSVARLLEGLQKDRGVNAVELL